MRKHIFLILFLPSAIFCKGQNWTWLKGSKLVCQENIYGTQGVLSSTNLLGSRQNSGSWYLNGDYYLFGGQGFVNGKQDICNDLWKYDSASKDWVWLKGSNLLLQQGTYGTQGVPDPNNTPGARLEPLTWSLNGQLYLYGGGGHILDENGYVIDGGFYGDLWKYDPITNQWTFLKGATTLNPPEVFGTKGVSDINNSPGGMEDAVTWTRNGKLYLFGGTGVRMINGTNGPQNDIFEYDPDTNNWTWINGTGEISALPTFDSTDVHSPSNNPGGRFAPSGVYFENEFFVFGGSPDTARGGPGNGVTINDLWKYDHNTNTWERIESGLYNDPGNYGTLGQPSLQNKPPARYTSILWHSDNKLYLYGGSGAFGDFGFLNDLWTYDLTTKMWTWIKGYNGENALTNYGILDVPQSSNTPGGRGSFNGAVTNNGIYIFGGYGNYDTREQTNPYCPFGSGTFQDLWKLEPALTCCGDDKICMCHFPDNDPTHDITICVSPNAVPAHLAKGCYIGTCPNRSSVMGNVSERDVNPDLSLKVVPNPASNYFQLKIESDKADQKISLRITDISGKLIEVRNNLSANQTIDIGKNYFRGVYIAQIIQGARKKQVKLVKL